MANPLRAATIWPSVAVLESAPGPAINGHYAIPEDRPILFEWVLGDATATSASVLGHQGGAAGRWHARGSVEGVLYDLGAALTDANETLTYSLAGRWRRQIVALTANRTKTLSTTGAVAGNTIEISREDTASFTLAVANGGVGGGTLLTMPAGIQFFGRFIFDGTNWVKRFACPQEYLP